MKPTLLILIYHGLGHIHATLGLAKILRKNYRVVYAGYPYFEKDVRFYGFDFVSVRSIPFALGFEKWTCETRGNSPVYLYDLSYRISDKLYIERTVELNKILNEIRPEFLLIDSWQSTDIVVLYEQLTASGTRVGFLQTMLSTVKEEKLPALNSLLLPDDPHRKIKSIQTNLAKSFQHLYKKIKYFGFDNNYLLQRKMKQIRFPIEYIPRKRSLFSPHFSNIPEVILAPAEFDFAIRYRAPCQRHIGFQTDMSRQEESDPDFQTAFNQLLNQQRQNGSPIIYCSLGSVTYDSHSLISGMLKKVIKASNEINAKLIIACNNTKVVEELKLVSGDHLVFKKVPQLNVLRFASVVISHGGLNTIKESLSSGVPMLILPVSDQVDHRGNSTRVILNGIGLRNDAARITVPELILQVNELLTNPQYKKAIQALLCKDRKYTSDKVLEAIGSLRRLQ